jgi:hypothetical protein
MARRRKLDDALDFGRHLQSVHELQSAGATAASDDILAILDVSEVDADGQPKKITLQELVTAGGGGGGISDGDKGDIIVSNSGETWTIDDGVVETANLGGDITTAGKAILDDADAAAQRTTLGLATVASTGSYSDLSGTPSIPAAADAAPQALGVQAVGVSSDYAREDHVHAMPSATDVGAAAVDQTTYVGTTAIALNRSSADQVLTGIQGITFPATQVSSADANTLDDYEEGTFTPTIVGTSVAGTGTYIVQRGSYVKIGDWVFVSFQVIWSGHTGTGNMRMSGLPFPNSNSENLEGTVNLRYSDLTSPANTFVVGDIDNGGGTQVRLYSCAIATGATAALAIDTAASLIGTVFYKT